GYGETAALEGNRFSNLAYVARLELAPFGPLGKGLPDLDKGGFRGGLGGAVYYDDGKSVTTFGYEIDLLVKVAGLHLCAELIHDSSSPASDPTTTGTLPTDTSRLTFAGEVGYVILAEQLGVTVRAELVDDDVDLDDNGDQLVLTGGVQYWFQRHHLAATLEYTHRAELEGLELDNDSLLLQLQLQL
ncbi:MAG: hypothetical protein KC635_26140, partial [Myxococcales bacterium]|nr:hypothetical protein [Myxococcales bacterium]